MKKITDIIFIDGKIETLSFFSKRLAKSMGALGYSIHFHDFYDSAQSIAKDIVTDQTLLITFNCISLSGEEPYMEHNMSLWRRYNVYILNILVDHPMYYHEQLTHCEIYGNVYSHTIVVCIDGYHLQYLNQYYPQIAHTYFMPLAGSGEKYYSPNVKPKYDLIFTGNFTPCDSFNKYIQRNGPEYSLFYQGIIDDLLYNPAQPIEKVCIEHIYRDIPDASDNDIRLVMSKMLFIDLYVRFYVREKVITSLADSGVNIHIIGKGWERARCEKNITLSGTELMPTCFCLDAISQSRISVNVMPWFKNGSHDRILSSMLCGSLALSDDSLWLNNNFTNMEDIVIYSISDINKLTSTVQSLLDNPTLCSSISEKGHEKALQFHTWNHRANEIHTLLNTIN